MVLRLHRPGVLLAHALHRLAPGRPGRSCRPGGSVPAAGPLESRHDRPGAVGQAGSGGGAAVRPAGRGLSSPDRAGTGLAVLARGVRGRPRSRGQASLWRFGGGTPGRRRGPARTPLGSFKAPTASGGWGAASVSSPPAAASRVSRLFHVVNPAPGDWRLTVATQDGRTISTFDVRVEQGEPQDPASRSF